MSTKTVPEKPYRIEERTILSGRVAGFIDFPNRVGALTAFNRSVRDGAGLYGPGAPYRLVLVGPDHKTLPAERTERPAEPGELCTCGRQAVTVYLGSEWGPTGACRIPDGGRVGPCLWCASEHAGRCPNYTLRATR